MALEENKSKKGRAKRSSTFSQVLHKSDNFFYARSDYGFNKYEARGLLFDNCRGILGLTYAEAVVLNALIKVTNFDSWLTGTPTCTATNRTIANEAGVAKATIPNCLRHLEDKGFIVRNYDEQTNQRIGEEAISIAPFASMLPELADKELIDYVVERRARLLGREVDAKEVIVTAEDKQSYSAEVDFKNIYGLDESGLQEVISDMEKLENNGQYNLWDYMDEVIEKEQVDNQEIVESVKKRNIKEVIVSLLQDLHDKAPHFNIQVLTKAHHQLRAENRRYEVPFNILYTLYAKRDVADKCSYLGKACLKSFKLMSNIKNKLHRASKSSDFIAKKNQTSKYPTLEELKGMFKYKNFTKHKELLRLIKIIKEPFPSVFNSVMFKDNKLVVRSSLFYQKFIQYMVTYNIDLKVVKDATIPLHYNNRALT